MLTLLFQRRFLPFFICQFLGAFNDSLFRLALVAMLSFGALHSEYSGALIQLAAALFMAPFLLFSAVAGDIADRIGMRKMLRMAKTAECVIMAIAAVAVYSQNLPLILLTLFLTGAQSAVFGPVKYAILPSLLPRCELLAGNAWLSVSTFVAILLGAALGGITGRDPSLAPILCGGFVALSIGGLFAAWLTPVAAPAPLASPVDVDFAPWRAFRNVMTLTRRQRQIFHRVIAASWFWLVAALLLNELPHLGEDAYDRSLAAIVIGVGIGAGGCRLLFRDAITTAYSPLLLLIGGALLLGIGQFSADVGETPSFGFLIAVAAFAAAMTMYVVPLRASIQAVSATDERARIFAGYNIWNAAFIVAATLAAATARLFFGDAAGEGALLVAAALTLLGTAPACILLPLESIRRLLRGACRLLFRVRVFGEEYLDKDVAVIIANHSSFLDALLLSVFLEKPERRLCFAIDVEQAKRFRLLLNLVVAFPLNPMEPHAIRRLIREIRCRPELRPAVFPEGRITTTGGLMKTYPGAGVIAANISGGNVIPVCITGAEFSIFSKMKGKFRRRLFPTITIHVGAPRNVLAPAHLRGQCQRKWTANAIASVLEESDFLANHDGGNLTTLFASRLRRHGGDSPLFSEAPARRLSRRAVYRAALAVGETMAKRQREGDYIGLLLPTSVAAAVAFWGLLFWRLTPVMLNPSAGRRQALSACKTATVGIVYTSEKLLERSPPTVDIVNALRKQGVDVIALESLRERISPATKLRAAVAAMAPSWSARRLPGSRSTDNDAACVLFTSGSEGEPKGVVLSHANLGGNGAQILARLDVTAADTLVNALPVFHSFGLIAGVILPVMSGLEAWQYPSPLHYRLVPEVVYGADATIFFSADTFLYNYGLAAHPMDFSRLRLAFAGAEKLKKNTRRLWADKFGVRLLEGYGVTETSPALALNSPACCKFGSVGRVLPGIETRLKPVAGVSRGGRLLARGVNVMRGYFLADAPGVLRQPPDGWHDTGDIADIDEEGYVTILGRAKRFVKIAGEMAPLDGIEERLQARWPNERFAIVGVPDSRRGEVLALMTTSSLSRDDIATALREDGLPDLWTPRVIKKIKEMPLLPTGKTDYPAIAAALSTNGERQ